MNLEINTPRWSLPILEAERPRYLAAYGGRGSGKSHSLAQSVKKLLENKIEQMGVAHLFDIKLTEIRSIHGGIIIFQGLQNHTADSIKSLEGYDIAWVEEAQSLSQFSLDILRPTIRKPRASFGSPGTRGLTTTPLRTCCAARTSPTAASSFR